MMTSAAKASIMWSMEKFANWNNKRESTKEAKHEDFTDDTKVYMNKFMKEVSAG